MIHQSENYINTIPSEETVKSLHLTSLENNNMLNAMGKLRGKNYFCRSNLKEMEIQGDSESDAEIKAKIEQLDARNRNLNNVNLALLDGSNDLKVNFRSLADSDNQLKYVLPLMAWFWWFFLRVSNVENDRLKDAYKRMKVDTYRLEARMNGKVENEKINRRRSIKDFYD